MTEKSVKPLEVDLDGILENVGSAGRYQIKHFLWTIIPVILCSLHANNYIFSAPDTKYRCFIPECDDATSAYNETWINLAIPKGDRCQRYAPVQNASTISSTRSSLPLPSVVDGTCKETWFDKSENVTCDGFVFEDKNSFVEEVDIPCEYWKRTLVGTMHSIGTLLALPMIGTFSDRFGRRAALVVSGVIEGTLGLVKSFSVNYPMFAAMECIEPTLGSGVYTSAYVLGMELLIPSTRVASGTLVNVCFATGQVLMGFTAWLFPYWRTFLQVIYAPSLLLFVYYWLLDESIRWLIQKRRYKEAIANLTKVAKTNKRELPNEKMKSLHFNADNVDLFEDVGTKKTDDEENNKKKEHSLIRRVLTSKILVGRVLKCSIWWITCTFNFYGLSINSVYLGGSLYVNFILSASVELPAHIAGYFALNYFGRKRSICAAFFIGGICILSFAFIPEGVRWASLVAYLLGKFCVTMAFSSIYLYTSELFPTPVRHSLLAVCSMIGRIGSITAPQTPLLKTVSEHLPTYLFSGTCLISALLMLTSPETLNTRLPETVEEAEHISSLKIVKVEEK